MTNPLYALQAKAQSALKGVAPYGKNICVDFGTDGALFVYGKLNPMCVAILGKAADADATIHISLAELSNLEGGANPAWEYLTDKFTVDGDTALAESFAKLVAGQS